MLDFAFFVDMGVLVVSCDAIPLPRVGVGGGTIALLLLVSSLEQLGSTVELDGPGVTAGSRHENGVDAGTTVSFKLNNQ